MAAPPAGRVVGGALVARVPHTVPAGVLLPAQGQGETDEATAEQLDGVADRLEITGLWLDSDKRLQRNAAYRSDQGPAIELVELDASLLGALDAQPLPLSD